MAPNAAKASLLEVEVEFVSGQSGPSSTTIEMSHQIKNLSAEWGRKDLNFDGARFPLVVANT